MTIIDKSQKIIVTGTLYIEGELRLENGNNGNQDGKTTITVDNNGSEGNLIVTNKLTLGNNALINVINGNASPR